MVFATAVKSCSAARAGRCIHIFPDAERAFAVAAIYYLFTEFLLSPSYNGMAFGLLMAFIAGIKAAAAFEFYSDYIDTWISKNKTDAYCEFLMNKINELIDEINNLKGK